jgi:hypothetical protein
MIRRFWLRFLCAFGRHQWFFQTIGDPEEVECRHCVICRRWQIREWRPSSSFRWSMCGGDWGPWEPYEPTPEPWGPVA